MPPKSQTSPTEAPRPTVPPKIKRSLTFFPQAKVDLGNEEKIQIQIIIEEPPAENGETSASFLDRSINVMRDHSAMKTSLRTMTPEIDVEDYWIPEVWPKKQPQRGHTCGLVALAIGLQYGYPDTPTPPVRKDGDKEKVSLRQIAKEKAFSAAGEIFNVNHLRELAGFFGFKDVTVTQQTSEEKYIETICQNLKRGQTVIVACDLAAEGSHFPGISKGMRTHWALIFGYYKRKDDYFFLVAHHGDYFEWSANDLMLSNSQLPLFNPRCSPNLFFIKNKQTKEIEFKAVTTELDPTLFETRTSNTKYLTEFHFGLCFIPATALQHSASLSTRTPELEAKKIRLSSPGK